MGGGGYSLQSRSTRTKSFMSQTNEQTFSRRSLENDMDPKNAKLRESRDSEEHPESVAVIIGLDMTGSMGSVPEHLVKEGLPNMMEKIFQKGIKDPQILFLGIGDHKCDRAPLQVGQFESSDELVDKWLTSVYLESGGGGNGGESYHLAWYFAAYHTSIDCFEKRQKKGFLFTIGDEPVHKSISKRSLQRIVGGDVTLNDQYSYAELLEAAAKKYHIYHIHINETYQGSESHVLAGWKEILAGNVISAKASEVSSIISDKVANVYGSSSDNESSEPEPTGTEETQEDQDEEDEEGKPTEEML